MTTNERIVYEWMVRNVRLLAPGGSYLSFRRVVEFSDGVKLPFLIMPEAIEDRIRLYSNDERGEVFRVIEVKS